MSFFKKLAKIFMPPMPAGVHYPMEVICSRCGEKITSSVNLNNDLSIVYGSSENDVTYFCRKVLMGEKRCFQQIEIEMTFDRNRKLTGRKIKGGKYADGK
jgi:hypothetical protein